MAVVKAAPALSFSYWLELPHAGPWLRARAEDRIRAARSTGLRNLPLHHTAQNKVWLEIVQVALDLLAWMRTAPSTAPPDPEQWNPAPTRGDTRAAALPTLSPARENGPPTPSADRHETSRPRGRFHTRVRKG